MSSFQAFVVRGKSGPTVTLQAGVDFCGYYWTTTSRRAAKVASLKRDARASVLSREGDSWRMRSGRGVILDPSRPTEAVRELPVFALAGTALALIALRYPEQVMGYLTDGGSTPTAWRLQHRVMIAMRHEGQLEWTDDSVIRRQCWLGLDTAAGPVVLPGSWKATTATTGVQAPVLDAVSPRLPGRACITLADTDSSRPSDATGVIVRGDASLSRVRAGVASIVVDVDSTTTWNGFKSTVSAA
ncbi:MAG: hypothetical protein ABI949_18165 [Ilumatobacteraceae bacterium]